MTVFQPRLFPGRIDTDPSAGISDEWYTPRHVIEAARTVLGGIDLDPASCATAQEVVQASTYYTKEQDGLSLPWFGRVWLNPPYSMPLVAQFTERAHMTYSAGTITAAIILTNNVTDTEWCQRLLRAYPMCMTRQRIKFFKPSRQAESAPRQGQIFFYLGADVARFTEVFSAFGVVKV